MTEDNPKPTHSHRPATGAELEPRGYALGANFHPAISLSKGGYNFAAAISEYLEARSVTLEPNQWTFSQPLGAAAGGLIQLVITPVAIQFDVSFPTHRMDWIANRCQMVLQVFGETFKPKLVLSSIAKVIGTIQIDGDAREFLVRHVSSLDPQRFTILKRPIHAFGIRVFCPPYEKVIKKGKKETKEIIPWHVDIKAESLMDDPTKLYLEADAQWPATAPWGEPKIQEIVGHLKLVGDYLGKDVIEFLQNPATGGTS
jgi:hypothetical protein